ncbi:hypothetical protein LPB72_04830 [Hydrogenophaga crassostreae]|uniref:PKD domain-containing protein n=1 Tax=Hydrogenophaga crassostreae TaxID=1763535 RepID=A0A167IMC4_9BURK|nr:PKD domain-containing protein [Hydrogenophaga crassostreae]AOW14720.1 hypothetical protein LPB072_19720 [Hydrogenophaga crassostreae]OAD43183.1 hypothetical protein LPB72_04830 [Hydrogenophaga crassostreae]
MNHTPIAPSSSARRPWSALLLKGLAAGALALSLSGCIPIPIIEYSPSEPEAGETVTFDGVGTIVSNVPEDTVAASYRWDFGDGKKGSGSAPTHVYENAGAYQVTLTVVDSAGRVGESQETVTVSEATVTTTSESDTTSSSTSDTATTTSDSTTTTDDSSTTATVTK